MLSLKKSWKKVLVVLGCMLIVGVAGARIPMDGESWLERTYYNASGTRVGGVLYDCNGVTKTWGAHSGAHIVLTYGPCH